MMDGADGAVYAGEVSVNFRLCLIFNYFTFSNKSHVFSTQLDCLIVIDSQTPNHNPTELGVKFLKFKMDSPQSL